MSDVPLIDCKNPLCARVARADELFCCRDCRTGNGLKRHSRACTEADKARGAALAEAVGYRKTVKPPKTVKLQELVDGYLVHGVIFDELDSGRPV